MTASGLIQCSNGHISWRDAIVMYVLLSFTSEQGMKDRPYRDQRQYPAVLTRSYHVRIDKQRDLRPSSSTAATSDLAPNELDLYTGPLENPC